jgi:ribosome biogenesis GTPase
MSDISDKSIHAQVIARFGQQADVEDAHGNIFRCHIKRSLSNLVCGDLVDLSSRDHDCIIHHIHERASLLARHDTGGKEKPIAANIDYVLIVVSPYPVINYQLVDRYIIASELSGIKPAIVVNKIDLCDDVLMARAQEELGRYHDVGYPVVYVSAKKRIGLESLDALLVGNTSILVGESGVGKSSIADILIPESEFKISEVSEGTGLGRHTTTTSRLYHLQPGGKLIDSPGIREFRLWQVPQSEIYRGYREFSPYLGQCKFNNCLHINEPDCAVRKAVEDQLISQERYNSYLKICEDMEK